MWKSEMLPLEFRYLAQQIRIRTELKKQSESLLDE